MLSFLAMNNVVFRVSYPSVQKNWFFYEKDKPDLISQPNETGQMCQSLDYTISNKKFILSFGMLLVASVGPFIIIIFNSKQFLIERAVLFYFPPLKRIVSTDSRQLRTFRNLCYFNFRLNISIGNFCIYSNHWHRVLHQLKIVLYILDRIMEW